MEKSGFEAFLDAVGLISIGTSTTVSIENGWSTSAGQSTTEGSNNGSVGISTVATSVMGVVAVIDDSSGPDIIVETKDHNTDYKPAVLIANTPEQAKALTEIFDMFDSEEDLYIFLTALQAVLEEMVEEEQKEKVKTKKLEK